MAKKRDPKLNSLGRLSPLSVGCQSAAISGVSGRDSMYRLTFVDLDAVWTFSERDAIDNFHTHRMSSGAVKLNPLLAAGGEFGRRVALEVNWMPVCCSLRMGRSNVVDSWNYKSVGAGRTAGCVVYLVRWGRRVDVASVSGTLPVVVGPVAGRDVFRLGPTIFIAGKLGGDFGVSRCKVHHTQLLFSARAVWTARD